MKRSLSIPMLALAACGGAPPRDVSNATLSSTRVYVGQNTHVVTEVDPSPRALAVLGEPDRLEVDRALDRKKQAADLLTLLDVAPGMRVAELGAGGGYTSELLARAVGDTGRVYAQNAPGMLAAARLERVWGARLARPVNARVTGVDRAFDAPLPRDARELDLVYLAVDYPRLAAMGVDMSAMNHAVHLALKSGGRYVVLDRTPPEGPRTADLHALHTWESRGTRREIESAGFALSSEARIFREGRDPRDWDAAADAPRAREEEKVDRFALVFVRP